MKESRKRDNILKRSLKISQFVNAEENWINLRSVDFYRLNFEQLRILVSEVIEGRKPHGRIRISKSENTI